MTKRYYLCLCLLLAGCTDADWDHAMQYGGLEDTAQPDEDAPQRIAKPVAVSTQSTAPAETSNKEFCNAVATQDAARGGFDSATQARVFARSYAQCSAIYTR
jgi:hypothetical protein